MTLQALAILTRDRIISPLLTSAFLCPVLARNYYSWAFEENGEWGQLGLKVQPLALVGNRIRLKYRTEALETPCKQYKIQSIRIIQTDIFITVPTKESLLLNGTIKTLSIRTEAYYHPYEKSDK